MDKQGRILVPQDLRDYAGLEKDVVLAGTGSHIEIWGLAQWDANNSRIDMGRISRSMADLGLII